MKNIVFFVVTLLYFNTCFSQDVVNRKKNLTAFVTEKYQTVIGAKNEVKQGIYQALYNKIPIATGQFTNNKKTGIWHFYSRYGQLLENYDYGTDSLLFEAREDTTSALRYFMDAKLTPTDRVTKPIRRGGRYYGYVPYLKQFKLPANIASDRDGYFAVLELLVSPGGRLADYKIHLKLGGGDEQIIHIDIGVLNEEDKKFIPATLNKQPVTSRIFIQCYVNNYDEIDML